MEKICETLHTPSLLVATPQVLDPFFDHSVVLLLQHTAEGSFGFNLNRPTEVAISEILAGLHITWGGNPETRAYFGGPVQPQLGTVLFGHTSGEQMSEREMSLTATEVHPGLRMTQHVEDLTLLAKEPPAGFRLYLGYAGWGAGQLEEEILRNDWIIVPVVEELLFCEDPQTVWDRALEAAGVDPRSLPAWTPDQSETETN